METSPQAFLISTPRFSGLRQSPSSSSSGFQPSFTFWPSDRVRAWRGRITTSAFEDVHAGVLAGHEGTSLE